jgi:tRNA-dihydrouridine synthase 3
MTVSPSPLILYTLSSPSLLFVYHPYPRSTPYGLIANKQLHGRSRQQRYSKLADWAYIKSCAQTLRESLSDAGLPKVPMFGNGDCFSAQQYYEEMEGAGVDGVMVARGALIKPWIFTEIKERREWDISATERLEGIRKVSHVFYFSLNFHYPLFSSLHPTPLSFSPEITTSPPAYRFERANDQYAEYGLSHWGSDPQGINTTRRFLLEALSFQHRYVPLGLLERLPAQMNERPPAYRGRNELENLLSSPNCEDWVRISEMFLGKVGDDYKFTPKHKTNSYGSEEAQG